MTRITGARVLVTGASRGIGEATAEVLAELGARLVLAARTSADLEVVAERLRARGAEVHVVVADVSKQADVERMVADAEAALGGIDILVNNAGLGLSGPVEEIQPDDLRYVFEVNVVAPHVATKLALVGMRQRGIGHIVNVGSVASHVSIAKMGGYAATKFGLKALTDALRMELGGSGVEVSLICPGPIKTDFVANVKGARRGHLPEQPFGAPARDVGLCIAAAIRHNRAEAFVPLYYQALVGANSVVPQLLRRFGRRGVDMTRAAIDRRG